MTIHIKCRKYSRTRQICTCVLLFLLLNSSFSIKAQINVTDSLGLVSLYNSTNGPNWYHNDNWLTGPVNTWFGVQTSGSHRVLTVQLDYNNLSGTLSEFFYGLDSLESLGLGYNNLTGTIPSSISSFERLKNLALYGNHLTSPIPLSLGSMPYLSHFFIFKNDFTGTFPDTLLKKTTVAYAYWIDSNYFDSIPYVSMFIGALKCRLNKLTFEDVLPYLQNPGIDQFLYYPQDSIEFGYDTVVILGDSIVLDSWCGGSGNLYRWKKGAMYVSAWDTISTLTINNIQLNQNGYYTCEVKNPGAPLLTLNRRLIHVIVNFPDAIATPKQEISSWIHFNPESAFLRIQLQFERTTQVKSSLYDIMGRKLMSLYDDNTMYQDLHYYLSWLKPGIYMVNLQCNGQQYSKKIVIR